MNGIESTLQASALNPVPLVNQPLVPDATTPGGGAFTLTVNGTGFVSGAVVYLKNQRNLAILTYITGEDGAYRFNNLSPDADYQVRAEANGRKSEPKSLSSFDSHKQAHIDLRLK